jgi:hypothetical protein
MGKASETSRYIESHPLTPQEEDARHPRHPKLRLKEDVDTVEVAPDTPVAEVFERMASDGQHRVALRRPDGEISAVVIPVERYVQLIGTELAGSTYTVADRGGRVAPAGLLASDVEQVDPQQSWIETSAHE